MAEAAPAVSESAQAKSPKPFVFERDTGGRAEGIIALFNRFLGRRRTMAEYRWEFYEGPAPGSHIWAIVESASDDVVGHHGIVGTPLVYRGQSLVGGRTENTIIEPAVRKKVFYPGMEKKAFRQALEEFEILYTVHGSGPQGRIRARLGYQPVGRWLVYLPLVRSGYLRALLGRLRDRVAPKAPDVAVDLAARLVGLGASAIDSLRRPPRSTTCEEVVPNDAFAAEYAGFWTSARERYDVTLDRSWEFLRWRVYDNPNLRFRTWAIRDAGELVAVVIGHRHAIGDHWSLYIDDIIAADYGQGTFSQALAWLPFLEPDADAVVLMTLDADTPLSRALTSKYPVQSALLRRLAPKVFDELVVYDRDQRTVGATWFVTALFTEGLDTSRQNAAGF